MSLLDTIKKKIKAGTEEKSAAVSPKARGAKQSAKTSSKTSGKPGSEKQTGASVQSKKYVYDMLGHPYITEKTSAMKAEGNKYVFVVAKTANKIQLRRVIQEKYKVKVTKVNMINIPSKTIMVGRSLGTKTGFRKAIITLQEGDSIESGV